jgi:hypothetical protein
VTEIPDVLRHPSGPFSVEVVMDYGFNIVKERGEHPIPSLHSCGIHWMESDEQA